MSKDHIENNLNIILDRIKKAAVLSNRNPKDIKLLLATKTVPADKIKIALRLGKPLVGENKVQEIKGKFDALKGTPHEMHFIGHLQTNKIKDILKYNVSCIQSVDRLTLAEKLHHRLQKEQRSLNIYIQVNTSDEASKFGVSPDHAIDLIRQVADFDTLNIRGLMTIGLFSADKEKSRACFKRLKDIQDQVMALNLPNVAINELSMGMSGDLEIAIEEGSTMVRVGTAIFGQRIYPDSYYWNESSSVQ